MEHTIPLVGDGESSGGVMSPRLDLEIVKNDKKGRKNKDQRKDHLQIQIDEDQIIDKEIKMTPTAKYQEDFTVPVGDDVKRFERVVDWEDRIAAYPESTQKIYRECFEK